MAPGSSSNNGASLQGEKLKKFSLRVLGQLAVIVLCGIAEDAWHSGLVEVLAFFMWRAGCWVSSSTGNMQQISESRFRSDYSGSFPVDITQLDVYRTERVSIRSHYQQGELCLPKEGDIARLFLCAEGSA